MFVDSKFSQKVLTVYFVVLYLLVLGIMGSCLSVLSGAGGYPTAFAGVSLLLYALLYLLPAIVLTALLTLLLKVRSKPQGWRVPVTYAAAGFFGTVTLLCVAGDRYLFSLYGYHFNASVWNLITTAGGIDSLGSTAETKFWLSVVVALVFVGNLGMLWLLAGRRSWNNSGFLPSHYLYTAVILLVAVLMAEEVGYAYARYTNNEPFLKASSIVPVHIDTSATKLFKAAGVERPPMQERIRIAGGQISYPARPLQTEPLRQYPNIVWLTAESFRWDLLDPEITPNLWKFSKKAATFNQHYSGGNRTRMGMFSMFYGLYAPYWYGFQEQKVRPQLMAQIAGHNYQLAINTSQSFSYPELKDTVFAGIPAASLQELQSGPSWQRDSENISDIIQFLQARDSRRPFFTFMFFESTHAPYNFPDSAVIRRNFLPQVNYLQLNQITGDPQPLHNRYINAAHHVDAEVGRILNYLEQEQLLGDTIVLFTGDHGEEFMENGHWGHGHNEVFPEQQIRVPLVLWIPGQPAQQIDYPTSHNQIPATILPLLGVTSPAHDYCSEEGLFKGSRPYRVVGSYDYLGVVDANNKLSFPFTTADYFHYIFSDSKDHMLPVSQQQSVLAEKQPQVGEVVAECSRFTRKNDPTVASRGEKTPLATHLSGDGQQKIKKLAINPLKILLFGKRLG